VVDSPKVLDPNRPIREADIPSWVRDDILLDTSIFTVARVERLIH